MQSNATKQSKYTLSNTDSHCASTLNTKTSIARPWSYNNISSSSSCCIYFFAVNVISVRCCCWSFCCRWRKFHWINQIKIYYSEKNEVTRRDQTRRAEARRYYEISFWEGNGERDRFLFYEQKMCVYVFARVVERPRERERKDLKIN